MKDSKLRIIVTGMIGQYPVGGVAWDYLHYVLGLARLGHDVYYHEDTWNWPYNPVCRTVTNDGTYSAQFLQDFFHRFAPDLSDRWHYEHLRQTSFGMSRRAFDEVTRSADLFLNVSGTCFIPDSLSTQCVKVFLDTDPGYNQIMLLEKFPWSENVERWCREVAAHDRHFTYAENIQAADCLVPDTGYRWHPTRPPVVIDMWSRLSAPDAERSSWSTVLTWNNFAGPLIHQGVEYKGKGAQFKKISDLPKRVGAQLSVALGGRDAPRVWLGDCGWRVLDGPEVTLTPQKYLEFIIGSRGEVSTAKHVYVALRTGWFSCRSVCYLAAGRPVVVEDTGWPVFGRFDRGLLRFQSVEEAAEQISRVEAAYQSHSAAAREIAQQHFADNVVLPEFIEQAMGSNHWPELHQQQSEKTAPSLDSQRPS